MIPATISTAPELDITTRLFLACGARDEVFTTRTSHITDTPAPTAIVYIAVSQAHSSRRCICTACWCARRHQGHVLHYTFIDCLQGCFQNCLQGWFENLICTILYTVRLLNPWCELGQIDPPFTSIRGAISMEQWTFFSDKPRSKQSVYGIGVFGYIKHFYLNKSGTMT